MKIINFNNVSEKYKIKFIKQKKVYWEEVWALRNINFQAAKGDVIGVIGKNGAGKTTFLKLIAGMLIPDNGDIHIKGKVSALMELGAGFNPEFTGIENIKLNAAIYGLTDDDLKQRMDGIVKFANLGKFINAPIKYYSQGMYMRLAFALAIFVEPDILLIDDILAVGDEEAQQKCIEKIFELKRANKTIILVSHNMTVISKLCNRIILLEKGSIVQEDLTKKVVPYYLETIGDEKGIAVLKKGKLRIIFNNGKVVINYNDFPISETTGGHSSFFVPSLSSWFSSSDLTWQITSFDTNKIIAEGRSREGVLLQTWVMYIERDYFKWQVEINDKTVKQQHANLLLIPQYSEWETLDEKGDFPCFNSKSTWHDLGVNSYPAATLALSSGLEDRGCPGLMIEQEDEKENFKIFNTGYVQEARVIQWSLSLSSRNLTSIKLFSDKGQFISYIKNKKQKLFQKKKREEQRLLSKQRKEQALLRAQRTISKGSLRLYADVEAKAIRLFYKDKEITEGVGLHSSFLIKNTWHDLSPCQWQVKKQKNSVNLYIYREELKSKQIWRFSFKDNVLLFSVDLENFQLIDLKLFKFGLLLSPQYKNLFCGRQQDRFPQEFNNWQDMILIDPVAKLCGVRKHGDLPAVILENKQNYSFIVQNSDKQAQCRVLQLGFAKDRFQQKKSSFSSSLYLLEDESLIDDYLKKEEEKLFKQQEVKKQRLLKLENIKIQRLLTKKKREEQRLLIKQQKEQILLRAQRTISKGNLRLYADVEAKAIRLFYKDKEITEGVGLHSSFLIKNTWHDLSPCQWQVKKQKNSLNLYIYREELKSKQIWRFSFKDNVLLFSADLENFQLTDLKLFKFGLLLSPQYKDLFCGCQQDRFPQEFNNWQDMILIDPVAKLCGVRKHGDLPAVILENNKNYSFIVQNSDKQSECRVLQLGFTKDRFRQKKSFFSASLYLLEDESLIDGYLKQEEERFLQEHTICSNDIRLFVDIEHKVIRLYHKNREITYENGINGTFLFKNDWHDLPSGEWTSQKVSNNKLLLNVNHEDLFMLQTWTFVCQKNTLLISVKVKHSKPELIPTQFMLSLCLPSRYKGWESAYEHGNFSNEQYIGDIAPVRLKDNKITEILLKPNSRENLPKLMFSILSQPGRRAISIHRDKQQNDNILCIDSLLLAYDKEKLTELDYATCFEGKIVLADTIDIRRNVKKPGSLKLIDGNLEFIFNQGKGEILLSGKELTSGLGVYTSIRSSGVWHDSYQAFWRISNSSNNVLKVIGYWPNIAISQVWQISIESGSVILWEVDMEVSEQLDFEICQANIMLCAKYKEWSAPHNIHGDFLDEYTKGYDILPFRFWYGKAKEIWARAESLPAICFINDMKKDNMRAVLENTDDLYRARLIQYQRSDTNKLPPGTYPYFKGKIKIKPQKLLANRKG